MSANIGLVFAGFASGANFGFLLCWWLHTRLDRKYAARRMAAATLDEEDEHEPR